MRSAVHIRSGWREGLRSGLSVCRSSSGERVRMVVAVGLATLAAVCPLWAAVSGGHSGQAPRPAGYLGIEFHDLTNEQAANLHLRDTRGVEVLLVDHDGPAATAGLRPHDLITGLNGHIVSSGEALRRMIHDTGAGVQVTLSVFRSGSPITIRTRLASKEEVERKAWARLNQPAAQPRGIVGEEVSGMSAGGPAVGAMAPGKTQSFVGKMLHGSTDGLLLEVMEPQLAIYFGAADGKGLLVESVQEGSRAAAAGLQAGDVIVKADSQPMRTESDWTKHLHAAKGRPVTVDVLREHEPLALTMATR